MKKICNTVIGIPINKYLKNNAVYKDARLIDTDYGRFAEMLGNRILRGGRILKEIFPGVHVSSVKELDRIKIEKGSYHQRGDLLLEISYENGDTFGKKIIIFEIKHGDKHGNCHISRNQLIRYCNMVCNPGTYFHRADEVKVIFMVFDKIDTLGGSSSYYMSELSKDIAYKIIESLPTDKCSDESECVDINGSNPEMFEDVRGPVTSG